MNGNGKVQTIAEYAAWYASRGWPVFPVHSVSGGACTCRKGLKCDCKGKHPRTPNGVKGASKDPGTVRGWWQKWPGANIGVACGEASGLVVLDVDKDHGGAATIQRLQGDLGELPRGPIAETGGGGWHCLFKHPGHPVPNRVGRGAGLDVRADGGYVVAPPSMHASGRIYRWSVFPGDEPLPELPAPWLEWFFGSCYTGQAPSVAQDTHRTVSTTQDVCRTTKNWPQQVATNSLLDTLIQKAIQETLPQKPGARHGSLFEFIRALHALGLQDRQPSECVVWLKRWYELAKPNIVNAGFADCYSDFAESWDKVRHPRGQGLMTALLERAKAAPLPEVAKPFEDVDPDFCLLIRLCRELQQEVGDKPFFLSTHTAAKLLNTQSMRVWRWLRALESLRVLTPVSKGDRKQASEYRYVGDNRL